MKLGKVAITGGSGSLGRHIVDYIQEDADVTVVDIRPPEQQEVRFVEADILDFIALEAAFAGQDSVIHLAAVPNPRAAAPDVTFNTNVQGTWNALQAAENAGVRRVLLASSDSTVGLFYNLGDWVPQYLPVDESHPVRPTEFYSLSKEVSEVIGRSFANRGQLEVVAIRPSKIVVPSEWPELEARGLDVRNFHMWAYVEPEDVAQGFSLALALKEVRFDVFHIAAAETLCSIPTLEMIEERLGKVPEVRNPELYNNNPYASIFDIGRARRILGYEPKSDWRRLFAAVPVGERITEEEWPSYAFAQGLGPKP